MAQSRIKLLKDQYTAKKAEKDLFFPMYELCSEYAMMRKQSFQSTTLPGGFVTEQLFSSVAPAANRDMASALVANMWPSGARTVNLKLCYGTTEDTESQEYLQKARESFIRLLDDAKAGLATTIEEYMLDQGGYGICGIERRKQNSLFTPIKFKSLNVKHVVVSENAEGVLDTFFIEPDLNVEQVVELYGIENVSKKVADKYQSGKQMLEKVRVIQVIQPRKESPYAFGNRSYPIASIHFEWDTEKILRESGYKTMPVTAARLIKLVGEVQGRSPSMFAMPAILRHNLVWELIMLLAEKEAEPPLAILDNGALGSGIVDTSPKGITVFAPSGLGEKAPIQTLFDGGNIQGLFAVSEELVKTIKDAYYLDRLFDFNNEARMTYGEAQMREKFRGQGMSSIYKRQEQEMFTPLLENTIEDYLELGLLGVVAGSRQHLGLVNAGIEPIIMPRRVANRYLNGQKIFELEYISPANRIMRTEELQGIIQTCDIAAAYSKGISPEFGDSLDPDKIMKRVRELTGSTERIARIQKLIDATRQSRAQQMQAEMQLRTMEAASDAQMKGAQAQSMMIGAMNDRPAG